MNNHAVGARSKTSRGIDLHGSNIISGGRSVAVKWVSPPHFFAKGKIIALDFTSDKRRMRELTEIMGPTIDPRAPRYSIAYNDRC